MGLASHVLGRALAATWAAAAVTAAAAPGPALGPRRDDPQAETLVSVVVPMRDEERNAAACVAAVLASTHRRVELIVVDDGSRDGTAAAVRAAAAGDPRVRLVRGAPLPDGWLGKPWACAQGAAVARGTWLVFCDADVRLAPEALATLLADAAATGAEAVSWIGRQELGSVWERVVNPVVLFFIAGLTPLPLATRPGSRVVAANGQFLAFSRRAYERIGGHAAVADAMVEDLALGRAAKAALGAGYRFVWTRDLMTTRMYRGLGELAQGWSKSIALGTRALGLPPAAAPLGALLAGSAPWIGTAAWLLGRSAAWPFAAAAACQATAIGAFVRRLSGVSALWGLAAPLGTAVLSALAGLSWWRTRRGDLRWRGRSYAAVR